MEGLWLCVESPFVSESMDAETLHHAKTSWNGTVRHDPHDHMRGFLVE